MTATALTAAAPASARPRLRAPALLATLALCAGAAPVAAQQPSPAAPAARPATPAAPPADDRAFWTRLREEARRFRDLHAGPLHYALRYRISPELARTIHDAANAEGIDPDLGFRLVRAESNFNPRARSRAGALGLTQLMPYTARYLDRTMSSPDRVMEPERNLRAGFRYLASLLERYDGDLQLALLAYNRGYGAVDRDLRRGRSPDNGYPRRVLGTGLDRYRGSGRAAPPAPAPAR